jgi:hypothetical protein
VREQHAQCDPRLGGFEQKLAGCAFSSYDLTLADLWQDLVEGIGIVKRRLALLDKL